MKFNITITQKGEYGTEKLKGVASSYEEAMALTDLVLTTFKEVDVELTVEVSNKEKESEEN